VKNKHLYALLDQSYTTIGVVFARDERPDLQQAPPAPGHQPQGLRQAGRKAPPWGRPDDGVPTPKAYTYKVPRDEAIAIDDYVVVHGEHSGLAIGRVVRVDADPRIDVDAPYDYKWIVQRVDRETYQRRVDAERAFSDAMLNVERVRQREQLVQGFKDNLPEGSEARRLFEQTVGALSGPVVDGNAQPQG